MKETNKQTNRQTNRQTKRQQYWLNYWHILDKYSTRGYVQQQNKETTKQRNKLGHIQLLQLSLIY